MSSLRLGIVAAVLAAFAVAVVRTRTDVAIDPQAFSWIATAHQLGPVSYRDPAGAISPDGRWMAYSEGRFLRVRPVGGGPSVEFPPGAAQIRHLAWRPDSRAIVADGAGPEVWALYDRAAGTSALLWPEKKELAAARQLAWSSDGRQLA